MRAPIPAKLWFLQRDFFGALREWHYLNNWTAGSISENGKKIGQDIFHDIDLWLDCSALSGEAKIGLRSFKQDFDLRKKLNALPTHWVYGAKFDTQVVSVVMNSMYGQLQKISDQTHESILRFAPMIAREEIRSALRQMLGLPKSLMDAEHERAESYRLAKKDRVYLTPEITKANHDRWKIYSHVASSIEKMTEPIKEIILDLKSPSYVNRPTGRPTNKAWSNIIGTLRDLFYVTTGRRVRTAYANEIGKIISHFNGDANISHIKRKLDSMPLPSVRER